MQRTPLIATGLILLLAGCSSGNNKQNAASATPTRSATPAVTVTPLAATPVRSPTPTSTPAQTTTVGGSAATAPATSSFTPTRSAATPPPAASPAPTAAPSPSAATAPSGPPPPPPIPTGTARGGRDSSGATLPVGDLCPLGFPVKGADDRRAYKQGDPEYATIRPVACFQTPEDAVTAGYTIAHP
ncbi:MAG TPA: hypothetical protein VH916_10095 [Dehalococcoidia bacterium]|jgi:hypothetical protein